MGGSIVGAVDLYLCMGGSIVGAIDLYFVLCARVICGREHSWSGYTWAGVLLERLIYILYHVYVGGNVARAVDLYIVSCARKLNVGGSVVGAVNLYYTSCARVTCGRECCWSG